MIKSCWYACCWKGLQSDLKDFRYSSVHKLSNYGDDMVGYCGYFPLKWASSQDLSKGTTQNAQCDEKEP